MKNTILRTGIDAFYDSFCGLVPVKVLSVQAPAPCPLPNFDLGHGYARVSTKVRLQVTKDFGAYKKGEEIETNTLHAVPKGAVRRQEFVTTIGVYQIEHDHQPAEVSA